VEFILIREKHLAAGALAALAREVLAAVRGTGTRVLVARRVDVALAVGADGVHLAGSAWELTVVQVRELMPGAFVSVSCHAIDEVRRAREGGASAVLFGPVFGKTVDGVEVVGGVGLNFLRQACLSAHGMSIFALGGMSTMNARECMDAGATGIAGIRMFFEGV
jgi:thiamine-phosphate pyrophosphorylase